MYDGRGSWQCPRLTCVWQPDLAVRTTGRLIRKWGRSAAGLDVTTFLVNRVGHEECSLDRSLLIPWLLRWQRRLALDGATPVPSTLLARLRTGSSCEQHGLNSLFQTWRNRRKYVHYVHKRDSAVVTPPLRHFRRGCNMRSESIITSPRLSISATKSERPPYTTCERCCTKKPRMRARAGYGYTGG